MGDEAGGVRRTGRPRLHPPQQYHPTSVRLNQEDLAQLDAICAHTGWSRNEAMRILLRLGFKLRDTIPPKDGRAALDVTSAA